MVQIAAIKGGIKLPFVHLHVLSAYSLLKSSAKVEELVTRAKQLGYTALALTDENVMYGAVAFYKECMKQGIKPLIGITVQILADSSESKQESFPLVLIAKNNEGYRNLLKISSIVQTKSKAGLPKKWLRHYSNGLIAITPGTEGEIEQSLLAGRLEDAHSIAAFYKQQFEQNCFYLSVQNHDLKNQQKLNESIIMLSRKNQLSIVATNYVHYINKRDAFAHECLLSIRAGTKLNDENRIKLPNDEYYLKSPDEMEKLFSTIPEAVHNSVEIANKCIVQLEFGKSVLPKYPVQTGETADEYLSRLCLIGLKERYNNPTKQHYDRLTYELTVIKEMNFSDYFLIVWDFMQFAHDNGIFTGPGRGSAAGSIVAYVLSITNVDPIKYSLLFERFLNPERISMPDIDIDFPDNRRDELIQYVAQKYGKLHVAQIITFGTLAAKAALRDVGRVMGLPLKEIDYLSKQVPAKASITLKEAFEQSASLRDYIHRSEQVKKVFETAKIIEGLPRHTSTHAAGVVISEHPLTDVIAVQEGHQGVYLTQFSMDILEEIGLLKMDFLGLRNLTLLDNICTLIYRGTGKKIKLESIPLHDRKTFDLVSKGDTTGVFQLESGGMRSVLQRLMPSDLEDIVAVNALYRPGPMENIPIYIARKHLKEPIHFPHPDLQSILSPTYGVIVYQEQIIQIASKMAGFSLGEADLLRRAVSKKKREVLDQERRHFVNGCLQKGYEEAVANEIYDLIVRFANYGFNRSHAVAYSFISYYLAYLKANYPLYFSSALLTSVIGNEEKLGFYIREMKQKGIKILPPSVNKSAYPFTVENGAIRFSLAAIKNVGASALKDIMKARKQRRFEDLFDFCVRTPIQTVNRKTLEQLVGSGAFDEFEKDRATLLASIDVAIMHAELVRPSNESQFDLKFEDDLMLKPKYVEVESIRQQEKLTLEKEALGFYLTSHPVSVYDKLLKSIGGMKLIDIKNSHKPFIKVVVYISQERVIRTKKGEVMAFLTISDETGDMDAVAFPTAYAKYVNSLQKGELVYLEGSCDVRENRTQLVIKKANKMADIQFENGDEEGNRKTALFLKLEKSRQEIGTIEMVKNILTTYHGKTPVIIYYDSMKKTIKLQEKFFVTANQACLAELKQLLGEGNVVLK